MQGIGNKKIAKGYSFAVLAPNKKPLFSDNYIVYFYWDNVKRNMLFFTIFSVFDKIFFNQYLNFV